MKPDISVVIPLFRAAGYLPGLLAALERQTFPRERFEVVLVDDCSPDDTGSIATGLAERSTLALRLIRRAENGGVSAARNTGWQTAQGDLIVFIDQDCRPEPDLLAAHFQAHAGQPDRAVAGKIEWSPDFNENPASEHYKTTYFPSWQSFTPGGPNFHLFITSNASVARAGLAQAGGFDERFRHNYDDVACGHRLERAGYHLVLCPAARVWHHRPLPVAEIFRRNFVAGREMVRFIRYYPELMGHPFLLNPAQALDWGDRLSTFDSLLDDTLTRLEPDRLAQLEPLLDYAARYLLQNPFRHAVDPDYLTAMSAQRDYQAQKNRVRWLEAAYSSPRPGPFSRVLQAARRGLARLTTARPLLPVAWPPSPKWPRPALPQPSLTVVVLAEENVTAPEWASFWEGLAHQTCPSFRVVVVVGEGSPGVSGPPDRVHLPTTPLYLASFREAARQTGRDQVVLLSARSVLPAGLLAYYAARYRPRQVLVGPWLPLPQGLPGSIEPPPPLPRAATPAGSPRPLTHFSQFSLLNTALPGRDFRAIAGLLDSGLSGEWARLAAGWKLAGRPGLKLRRASTNPVYLSQVHESARQLRESLTAPAQRNLLRQVVPDLARLYDRQHGPSPAPADLILLYDTLKEYPLALGVWAGLQEIFDIHSYTGLQTHPLFEEAAREWAAQRATILRDQLARLENGRVELETYLGRLASQAGGNGDI